MEGSIAIQSPSSSARVLVIAGADNLQIGRLLPLISRAVISACMPDVPHAEADYNVVQNNGPGAAQVIPHAHFHVIPRYPFDYTPPKVTLHQASERKASRRKSGGDWKTPKGVPEGMEATKILFGRGQRHYRDDEDAEDLVKVMRDQVRLEWEKEFGKAEEQDSVVGGRGGREKELSVRGGWWEALRADPWQDL